MEVWRSGRRDYDALCLSINITIDNRTKSILYDWKVSSRRWCLAHSEQSEGERLFPHRHMYKQCEGIGNGLEIKPSDTTSYAMKSIYTQLNSELRP